MTWKPDQARSAKTRRGEFGFAEIDAWNGDTYLAGLVGTMALNLRDHGSSYPEHVTTDEWHEILTKIGEPLVAYAKAKFTDLDTPEVHADARDAWRLFAEWFDHFWD